jgi:dipeptidyl aminopeptidase/acylaminoacyl peptidase
MSEHLPYGSWPSPVTTSLLVAGTSRLGDVEAAGGATWWSESRPEEEGREQIVCRRPDGTLHDVLPAGFSARSRVHEYGGGAWWAAGATMFVVNYADQRLYRVDAHGGGADPVPVSPVPCEPHALRYADGRPTPDGRFVVVVRERHETPGDAPGGTRPDVHNEIVLLEAGAAGGPAVERVLVDGRDFVAAPRVSPDGRRLAWLAWDHPDMPWDATELWVGDLCHDLDGSMTLRNPLRWAGGPQESLVQPEWGPDGRLYVVSDATGWWNVHRVDAPDALLPLCPLEAEVGTPAWRFGQSHYQVAEDGTVWFTYTDEAGGRLVEVPPGHRAVVHGLDCVAVQQLRLDGDRIVALVTKATSEPAVIEYRFDRDPFGRVMELVPTVLRPPRDTRIPEGAVSHARRIDFPSTGGRTAHGWFYPPAGDGVAGPHGERPPLLVGVHGGPTDAVDPSFRLAIQFWTTRGFAVVEVDHGGSTGYGRPFRRLLDGSWGIVDVEDVCAAARWLAAEGMVDGDRMAIRGGSAGGFTALAALATTDVFAAGASRYGVADLASLARDTHKFESRYLDRLIGPWPEAADVYRERSPLFHLDGVKVPVIILQGLRDEVVPCAQAEMIVSGFRSRGIPHAYLTFEDEMHGFRLPANVVRAITAELYFYSRVFGFDLADDVEPVDIVGWPTSPSPSSAPPAR